MLNQAALAGLKVIVNPMLDNWPKFQLSPKFAAMMPPSWADETNQWMREFFGTESRVFKIGNHTLMVGPKVLEQMKDYTKEPS